MRTRGRLATLASNEGARSMSLRSDQLRGGGRSGRGRYLSLHRLPDADGLGVPGHGARTRGDVRPSWRAPHDLHQDRRQRRQTGSRVLPGVRCADLCDRRDAGPAGVFAARRCARSTRGATPDATAVVQLCVAMGDGPPGRRASQPAVSRLQRRADAARPYRTDCSKAAGGLIAAGRPGQDVACLVLAGSCLRASRAVACGRPRGSTSMRC
jgi:hypothetical protein